MKLVKKILLNIILRLETINKIRGFKLDKFNDIENEIVKKMETYIRRKDELEKFLEFEGQITDICFCNFVQQSLFCVNRSVVQEIIKHRKIILLNNLKDLKQEIYYLLKNNMSEKEVGDNKNNDYLKEF